MIAPWIGVDWGTSALHTWALAPDGAVIDARPSPLGMAKLSPGTVFEANMLGLIKGWIPATGTVHIAICGIACAKKGWWEAPYRVVPYQPISEISHPGETQNAQISVTIVPGLCQNSPADMMRSEETQIAGFCALHPDFIGRILLPGTHKNGWVCKVGGLLSFKHSLVERCLRCSIITLFCELILRAATGTWWPFPWRLRALLMMILCCYQRFSVCVPNSFYPKQTALQLKLCCPACT